MVAASELPININASALQMAQAIFGPGVTVVSASYTGDSRSSGIFSDGDSIVPGVTPSDTGVILSTGRAQDFTNSTGDSNQTGNRTTNTTGPNNDQQFNALAGAGTRDASILDVDFVPTANTMSMQFIFSSEEYPEFVGSIYNDLIGVWVNGVSIPVAITNATPSINTVSPINNLNLYNDNTADQFNTEMDGFSATMVLDIPVTPNAVNSIRIGVADVADSSYDSNLLIAGDSLQTQIIADDDSTTIWQNGQVTLDVLANDTSTAAGALTITQINGVNVVAGDMVTLPTGQVVTLNPDGTFDIQTDADIEEVNFTYGIQDSAGQTDVAFVTVDTVPCFVAGTMIQTQDGKKPVEDLLIDDLVITRDNGAQPVRWVGRRSVPAVGAMAPVRIGADLFGEHGALMLSPLHRVLIRDAYAQIFFGVDEVLVAAKELVNDRSIRRIDGGTVDYVHILFDQHEVIFAEGLPVESFLPGPQATKSFEQDAIDEICEIFPELNPLTGDGYGPAARRTLRSFEARLLVSHTAQV